jgi:putative heme transporter
MAPRTTLAPAHDPPSRTTRPWMVMLRRRWIWIILGLACLLVAARAVSGGRAELLAALGSLSRVSWIWLLPAVAAECCAFTGVALAQRRILRAGGVNVSTSLLARLAVTSQAVGSVLPAGYLFSGVVVLKILARRGVSQLLVLWMLAVAGLLYLVTLLLLGLIGAQLAPAAKNVPDLRAAAAITLAALVTTVAAGMAVARLRKRPWTVHEIAARMPGGPLKRLIGGDVLTNVSLGPRGWGISFLWMLLYWTCDLACLTVSFPATGTAVPWRALLIAYTAGQLAALLPIMPGGLGAIGSMSAALAAYGSTPSAQAAVLLYRLIGYWAVLLAGAICYLSLRRRRSPAGIARTKRNGLDRPACQATSGRLERSIPIFSRPVSDLGRSQERHDRIGDDRGGSAGQVMAGALDKLEASIRQGPSQAAGGLEGHHGVLGVGEH